MSNAINTRKSFSGKASPLHKLCFSITDCHHSTPRWCDDGKIVVRNFNIKNGKLDLSCPSYTDEKTFKERISRAKPEAGDLIITREAPMGELCVIPAGIECCLGQRMVLIKPDPKKIGSRYLLYAMLSEFVQGQINRSDKTGSIVSNLRIPLLKELEIPLIDGSEEIAAVLSTIDAKIDCNNRISAELEAMAKTLFDYWFVQFNFPDANGKPYKSSGGKMVHNAILKREIPKGWADSSIQAIADLLGGGTPTKKKSEYWGGDIPFFTPTDADGTIFKFSTADYITDDGLKGSSTKLFGKNTVFITARGSVGRLVLAGVDMAMNQSCYALRAKPGVSHVFLFYLAKELIHHLHVKSSGSVFNSIVSNDIELTNLAIPKGEVITKFAAVVEPMFEKIGNNTKENQHLATLRDWLLPMLMNGQVTTA
ncbi:restriction endonuclease subunit S [Collimonas fungivorans]|uniref:Restriction modification system DNA specificity domain protein n=1 Tax=Collimonas fungivorans (strain Ter331) TaxID=1005048 RepID=G0A7T4_COLFT|nr:restriction endonuclease subunit S [Collimonas fungivorans]AEK59845.1 restriction modification system DNA specificity domain protein [Collimonas fungivorans Ter331]